MTGLEREITSLRTRIAAFDEWLDERFPFDPRRDCCPGCLYGAAYREACAKQDRRESWLVVLRTKQAEREVAL